MAQRNLSRNSSFAGEPHPLCVLVLHILFDMAIVSRIDTAQSCGPLCKQEGVFRVNCMDCLDRTNVVESIFSKEVLQMAVSTCNIVLEKLL